MANDGWRKVLLVVAALAVVVLVAVIAFKAGGGHDGMRTAAMGTAVAGGAAVDGHRGWDGRGGFGWFFFPFLLFPLGIFLVFALARTIFGGPRGYGGDHDAREERYFEDWHRRLHEGEQAPDGGGTEPPAR